MKKVLTVLTLLFALQGCASLNPLSIMTQKPSVEVNAQVAKNAKQEKNIAKVEQGTTNQNADQISNDTSYKADTVNQITNSLTPFQLMIICLLAGWAVPDPARCYSGVRYIVVDVLRGFIVYPLKSFSGFVLQLFGKGDTYGNRESKTVQNQTTNAVEKF